MAGKRRLREQKTIHHMIALFAKYSPAAKEDAAHYETLYGLC